MTFSILARTAGALGAVALALGTAPAARAADLPADVRIVYDVLYGSNHFRVGRADQHWHVEDGRYELTTDLSPIIGPHIRYVSKGRVGPDGLVPDSFGEYRSGDKSPRVRAEFDWATQKLLFGRADESKTAALEPGAQDVNALAYQLAWMGGTGGTMQVATGKSIAKHTFAAAPKVVVSVGAQKTDAVPVRAGSGVTKTEVWLAPQMANLPVRVVRVDDDKELQFVAREVKYTPPAAGKAASSH